MKLYFSMIYPDITQNIIIWSGVSTNKLKHIHILMNKSLRLILKVTYNENHLPSITVNEMHKKLELFNLSDIHKYFCLKFIYELLYGSKTHIFIGNFSYLLPDLTYSTRGIKNNVRFWVKNISFHII